VSARSAEVSVSVISVEEQLSGWYTRLRRAKKIDEQARAYLLLAKCAESLAGFPVRTYSAAAITHHSQLRRTVAGVGSKDLAIAAIALEHGAIVVTRNMRDFQRVPGLIVEDWSQ